MPSSSSKQNLTAIVAATKSNGIGLNGTLPWRLPGEMKYFATVTTGSQSSNTNPTLNENQGTQPNYNAVIMGRKTWESIPGKFRPLKDRLNLVISRAGIDVTSSPQTTSHPSLNSALTTLKPTTRAFLIGGSQLYNLALTSNPPLVNRVLLTRILTDFECDTFLNDFTSALNPQTGKYVWEKKSHSELCDWIGFDVEEDTEEKGVKYRYEMWTLVESEDS